MSEATPSLGDVAPEWLSDNLEVLEEFLQSPAGFILGAVLSQIFGGIETLFEAFLDGLFVIVLGSDGELSAEGALGIADMPVFGATLISAAYTRIGNAAVGISETITSVLVDIAALGGPLSPIIFAAEAGLLIAASVWFLRTLISIVADAIPGVQGLVK